MKIPKEAIIAAAKLLANDFRVLHGKPTLSFPEQPDFQVKMELRKSLILLVGDWRGNGEDMEAATKNMAYQISKGLDAGYSMQDFK